MLFNSSILCLVRIVIVQKDEREKVKKKSVTFAWATERAHWLNKNIHFYQVKMASDDDKKDEKIGRNIYKEVWSEAELLLDLCKTQAGLHLDLLPPSPGLAAALHGASQPRCLLLMHCLPSR